MEIKIPLYNVLNMFLTGFVFLAGIITLYPMIFIEEEITNFFSQLSAAPEIVFLVCFVSSAYEIGLILNRVGSVLIEPILRRTHFMQFSQSYSSYSQASQETPTLNTLSREYALSRTSTIEFLILAVWGMCIGKWLLGTLYISIAIVFLFSCRKHSAKITTIVEEFHKSYKSN